MRWVIFVCLLILSIFSLMYSVIAALLFFAAAILVVPHVARKIGIAATVFAAILSFVGFSIYTSEQNNSPVAKAHQNYERVKKESDEKIAGINAQTKPDIDGAKAELKAEPKIKDLFVSGSYWNVGVLDDGTSRIGYASYVCNILKEHGVVDSSTVARVVDIARVARENASPRDANLGSVRCSTFAPE